MLKENGKKRGRENLRRMQMDVSNYFEYRGNGSREIGRWKKKSILLSCLGSFGCPQKFLEGSWVERSEEQRFSYEERR